MYRKLLFHFIDIKVIQTNARSALKMIKTTQGFKQRPFAAFFEYARVIHIAKEVNFSLMHIKKQYTEVINVERKTSPP